MFYVIEKIEGQWATIEFGKSSFQIPKSILPSNAKQGDKIKIEVQLESGSVRLRG